jgi:hypothetical protein
MVVILSFLLFLLSVPLVHATAYYADADGGADDGACTVDNKCATPNFAFTKFTTAGDILNLKCGDTYRLTSQLTTPMAGTTAANNVVQQYGTCVTLTGVHNSSANSASLVDTTRNFTSAGVTPGMQVLNKTDGSSCIVTSISTTTNPNDTLNCSFPLRGGKEDDWDAENGGDEYYISNAPVITFASHFNTAENWTNQGSNVWSHAVTNDPKRSVWINRQTSTASQHYTGSCTVVNLASQADLSFCTTSTTLYLRSSSNPAMRWASPNIGVEVAHLISPQITTFIVNDNYWQIKDIHISMSVRGGNLLTLDGVTGVTIDGIQLSNSGPRFSGGSGGNGGINLVLAGNTSDSTVKNSILRDSGRGTCCGGTDNTTRSGILFENNDIYNTLGYTAIDSCVMKSSTCSNITWRRNKVHNVCSGWFSGNQGSKGSNIVIEYNSIYDGIVTGDPRIYVPANGCGTSFGIQIDISGTFIVRNNLIRSMETGIRNARATVTADRNVIYGNSKTGYTVRPTSPTPVNILTNNVIAENGTSGRNSATNHQVGCQSDALACSNASWAGSNYNLYWKPSGRRDIGYYQDGNASQTIAKWRTTTGAEANSSDADPNFVSVATTLLRSHGMKIPDMFRR